MQKHWKAIQWISIVAMAAFVAFAMSGKYLFLYATVFTAIVIGMAYLIGVARFRDRSDQDAEPRGRTP